MRTHLWNSKETEVLPNKGQRVSLQQSATLPAYRLKTERRLRLTGMSTTVCLKSFRYGVNGVPNVCPWSTAPSWQCQRAHSSCNSELSSLQWCSAGHLPTIFTWLSLLWLVFVPSRQKTAEGKAVSERRRWSSIHRGRQFGHTSINVVGCHGQLVWEDGQMCTGWGGFLRKTWVDRVVVNVVEKSDCKT